MEGRVKVSFGFCMSGRFVSKSHIFDNISKWLQVDNKGMLLTHCPVQNPLLTQRLPPEPGVVLLLMPCPSLLLAPFRLPLLSLIGCWSWGGSPELYVQVGGTSNKSERSDSFIGLCRYPLVQDCPELDESVQQMGGRGCLVPLLRRGWQWNGLERVQVFSKPI